MPKTRPCAKCNRNRSERFFVSERGRVCATCRKRRVRNASRGDRLGLTYGLNLEQYEAMFKAQGEACAICQGKRRENLDVDHDHKTGLVRGLLCRRCNRRLLPAAQDSVDRLYHAINYLLYPPALAVLGEHVVPKE